MVKGLRYWLQASTVINSTATKTVLGELGNKILAWDRYFESDKDRMCECTDYATQQGLGPTFAKQYSGYTTWWLRDIVINGKQASTIDLDGSIHGSGDWVDAGTEGSHRGKVGVRPVICVRYD